MLTIQKIYERKEEDYEKQLQKLSHESQILQMAIQNINQKSYTESFLEDKPQKLQEKPEKMVNTPVLKPGSFYLSALNRKKGPISPNLPLQTSQNSDIETIRGSLEYGSEITEVQDLKKNVSLLQEEHTKMISLIENVLKNDSKLDNSDFINNCFDKLFDQLTKSLEKAGELRVRINNLEDKINKNENYNKKESFSNINDDSFKKLELENQQYKSLCKELQIQLDFKRAQMNFMQKETEKNKEIATKSSYLNSNENFNSEIISKPTNNNTNEFYNQISHSNEKKKEINLKQQAAKISNYTITDRKANFFNKNKLVEVSRDYSESHNHGKIGNSQEIEIVPNISVNFLKNDNLTPNKKKDSKNIRRSPAPNKKSPFVNKDMYNAKWLN